MVKIMRVAIQPHQALILFASHEVANERAWQVAQVYSTKVGQGHWPDFSEWRGDFYQAIFPEEGFLWCSRKAIYRVVGGQHAGRISEFEFL